MLLHFGVAKGTKDCYATKFGEYPWMFTNQTDIDARLLINDDLKTFESQMLSELKTNKTAEKNDDLLKNAFELYNTNNDQYLDRGEFKKIDVKSIKDGKTGAVDKLYAFYVSGGNSSS